MNNVVKFLIGAGATSLLALAAHASGAGQAHIDRLGGEARARLAAAGEPGVSVAMVSEPSLRRVAELSGEAGETEKIRLLGLMRAIPGMAEARWEGEADRRGAAAGSGSEDARTATAVALAAEAPATVEAVRACQAALTAAVGGRAIGFEVSGAALRTDARPVIDAVAEALGRCTGTRIEVGGHTDRSGSVASNQALSQARAEAVVAALVAQGAPAGRLTARGYGSTREIAHRVTIADYAANRRIEFVAAAAPAPAGR